MKKVKTFLRDLTQNIIPNRNFYHTILHLRFVQSLKYFMLLVCVGNFIIVVSLAARITPNGIRMFQQSVSQTLRSFPDDLAITINNGKLVSNYNRPYFLWMDWLDKKLLPLVVDENASPEKIKQYNSFILLTRDNYVVQQGKDGLRIGAFPSTIQHIVIDKKAIMFTNTLLTRLFVVLLVFVLVMLLIFVPLAFFFTALFYIGVNSALVYFIYNIYGKKISFKKTFQIALHSSTLPLILIYSVFILNTCMRSVSFHFFFLVFIFLLCGVYETYFDLHHPQHHLHTKK